VKSRSDVPSLQPNPEPTPAPRFLRSYDRALTEAARALRSAPGGAPALAAEGEADAEELQA
jgi:hypothetical protein